MLGHLAIQLTRTEFSLVHFIKNSFIINVIRLHPRRNSALADLQTRRLCQHLCMAWVRFVPHAVLRDPHHPVQDADLLTAVLSLTEMTLYNDVKDFGELLLVPYEVST